MNGYKIGEVSRTFGIPNDTLRYYESCGIITPKRDEESGYRYYDVWDMNYLLDSLWYRGYGFSIADTRSMVKSDDLDTFLSRCYQRERELLKAIEEYQLILKQLTQHGQKLRNIEQELGKFTLEDSPAMVWQRQRDRGVIEKGESAGQIRRWVELMPFVNHTFVMPEIKPARDEFSDYCWGFSLTPERMKLFGMDLDSGTEYIPSFKSVYTVFSAGGENTFMDAFNAQVINPIKERGYKPSRPPVGNLLVRVHQDGGMKRYFEVWVPIE